MRTTSSILSVAVLAAVAHAGGSIDNTAQAAQLAASASTLSGAGNYVFTNVKTGKSLDFPRNDGTTDFFPTDGASTVAVQFNGNAARISGGNNKCASAQWSYDVEGGVDHAAVSYACKVGSGLLTGTESLEETKQWWYIVPAGTTSDDSSDDSVPPAADSSDDSDSSDAVVFAASGKDKTAAAKVAQVDTSLADSSPRDDSYESLGYHTSASSTISLDGVDLSKVDKHDRTTWVCRHPGWWLADHPAYVTEAGHVECASDLEAYLADQKRSRMVRRSRPAHSEMAKKLAKKGQQTYYLVAVDHILDMATRAMAHEAVATVGGYTSTKLSLFDQSNDGQLWTISPA